jgi:hypothetical protein
MADVDDGSIKDDACLLRRIRADQIVDDENTGTRRPSSAAFRDPEMSVDAAPILAASGLDWHFCVQGYEGFSLVNIEAVHARAKGLAVIHKPIKDDPTLPNNLAHAEVIGKKTKGIAKYLAANAAWVHLDHNRRPEFWPYAPAGLGRAPSRRRRYPTARPARAHGRARLGRRKVVCKPCHGVRWHAGRGRLRRLGPSHGPKTIRNSARACGCGPGASL